MLTYDARSAAEMLRFFKRGNTAKSNSETTTEMYTCIYV